MEQPKSPQPPTFELLEVHEPNPPSRRRTDWAAVFFFSSTLVSIIAGGCILLDMDDAGDTSSHDNLRVLYVFSALFLALASAFNEALFDRCWRRVSLRALSGPVSSNNLRAANFGLAHFLKRLSTCSLSSRELTVAFAYLWLKGGAITSMAVTQLTVTLEHKGYQSFQFHANVEVHKAGYMIAIAVLTYSTVIVIGLASVGLPPWALFCSGYGSKALRQAYQPYLERIHGGSIARYKDVANVLDNPEDMELQKKLESHHRPGIQFAAKLKSMGLGISLTVGAVVCLIWYLMSDISLEYSSSRTYAFTFACLAANLGFTLTLDQIVWNLSLEAISMTNGGLSTTLYLGSTSGIMLATICFKGATCSGARWLLWICLIQAVLVRAFFIAAIGLNNFDQFRSNKEDLHRLYYVGFWAKMLGPTIGIPFCIFLITPLRVPVSDYDGWRLAKVLEGTDDKQPIAYGEKNGYACCGRDVIGFSEGLLK